MTPRPRMLPPDPGLKKQVRPMEECFSAWTVILNEFFKIKPPAPARPPLPLTDDVLQAAKRVAYATEERGQGEAAITSAVGVDVVCQAILAERQRCADIAELLGNDFSPDVADHIREAILGGAR